MKCLPMIMVVSLCVLASFGVVLGQDYSIDWYTTDGGGVMFSTGGDFEVSGTIGQPDAGVMTGGEFELTGGFWFSEGICSIEDVIAVDPPHCAIDARQPHRLDDPLIKFGWDPLRLVFELDPTSMALIPGDFTVATYSNGTPATPPGISAVLTDGPAHAVTIMLDKMIEPRNWTCITHTDSGNYWCMGYLPADVNQDGLSATPDINKLIDCLNLVVSPPCRDWQTDIDRSGIPMPQDILREIDLLNGANPFDVWITESLPKCP